MNQTFLPVVRKVVTNYFGPILITLLVIVLFTTNYIPGTWLSGWDTLHPEFNFPIYFQRTIFGAWQEHQGVGAPAAQAHAAELPRVIILYLLSWVLPLSSLRYVFIFLCLWGGGMGSYFLSYYLLTQNKSKTLLIARLSAFLASLVYLCNLTVVQQFYVPLEMFTVHFATLPWIVLSLIRFYRSPSWKNGLILSLISIFSAPMAHTSTLYYAMILGLGLSSAVWIIMQKFKLAVIAKVIAGMSLLVLTNFFWLLPNVYFILHHSNDVAISSIHATFSDEAFFQGRVFGDFNDVLLQRNFLFNWREYDREANQYVDLLDEWELHYSDQFANHIIAYLIWIIAAYGLYRGTKARDKKTLFVVPMLFLSFFFLINANFPLTKIYLFLRDNSNLFKEGLRFPFTKFSIMQILPMSVLFGYGLANLLEKRKTSFGKIGFTGILAVMITFMVWPMYQGNLISPSMKVRFPENYFDMYEWFSQQDPQARIAKLPLQTQYGWNYYDWDYQGAGFTWFGLAQPTFDREFDRWSKYNESFYNEASFALYAKNMVSFRNTLKKYRVEYLLLDESVLNAGGEADVLFFKEINDLFSQDSAFTLEKRFGFLSIYRFNQDTTDWVWAPNTSTSVQADLTYNTTDQLYASLGDYISTDQGSFYPFSNFDARVFNTIELKDEEIVIDTNLEQTLKNPVLNLPDYVDSAEKLHLDIYASVVDDQTIDISLEVKAPYFLINNTDQIYGRRIWQNKQIPVNLDQVSFLSIGTTAIDLRKTRLSDQPKIIGSVSTSKNQPVDIVVYGKEGQQRLPISQTLPQRKPRLCINPDEKYLMTNVVMGEFKLEVQDESICLGETFEVTDDVLLEVSFKTESNEGVFPWFCISPVGIGGCVNDVIPQEYIGTSQLRDFYFLVPTNQGEYWFDFVAQAIEDNQGSILYKDFDLISYNQIYSEKVNLADNFASVSQPEKIQIEGEVSALSVVIPTSAAIYEDFSLARGNYRAVNCELENKGSVLKRNLISGGLYYRAQDGGVSCDFFDYNRITYDEAFILRIKGVNSEGRGLKFYLRNQLTGKTDLEKVLPLGEFDEKYVVYSRPIDGQGYTLNLETRAFGRLNAENKIEEISYWPMPAQWLAGVSLDQSFRRLAPKNGVIINSYQRLAPTKYSSQVQISADQKMIGLGQGYNPGWVAYADDRWSALGRLFPWLTHKPLKHWPLNNWSNAWEVPTAETNSVEPTEIIMLYWPQQLVWLGWGINVVIITSLGVIALLAKIRFQKDDPTYE